MSAITFETLGLPEALLSTVTELGYETPTHIQAQSIPVLLKKRDLSAQAQTGTGKTASFALPILSNLDLSEAAPQALVIAPTRELAIQVAEAFQSYAKKLKGFQVAPIYGGQDFKVQLRALKRGSHVVVGTPGRIMDHMRRGTLSMDSLKTIVLDEADEMLKMGFVDDVEWILEQIPHKPQTALFSATMPPSIQKIAKKYLNNPETISIKPKEMSETSIEQVYTCVPQDKKIHVLTSFLEVEDVNAAIIFSRTKTYSTELAEKLQARGYAAAALNGDMNQASREKVIERLKKGSLDIIVATDVAARGIDVERVSHVINYDVPYDSESYIHRIGRTGRAGRSGKALLLITPREHRLLKDIERNIQKTIKKITPPSVKEIHEKRDKQLIEKVTQFIKENKALDQYRDLIKTIVKEHQYDSEEIAAAFMYLIQQANPVHAEDIEVASPEFRNKRRRSSNNDGHYKKPSRPRFSSGPSDSDDFGAPRRKKRSFGRSKSKSFKERA